MSEKPKPTPAAKAAYNAGYRSGRYPSDPRMQGTRPDDPALAIWWRAGHAAGERSIDRMFKLESAS